MMYHWAEEADIFERTAMYLSHRSDMTVIFMTHIEGP